MQHEARCWECSWNVSTNDRDMFDHMCAQHVMRYDHELLVKAAS